MGFGFWLLFDRASALASFGMALAAWLALATLYEFASRVRLFEPGLAATWRRILRQPRASWGMVLGHFGLAIAIAGMAGAGGWTEESIQTMKPGQTVAVSGYAFTFKGAAEAEGPNYTTVNGTFEVRHGDDAVITMVAEKRNYPVGGMPTTEAAIHTLFSGDLYAVIGDAEGTDGAYVTRLYFNPLVVWMWIGTLVMIFAAALSLTDRRYRVGAPRRSAKAAISQASPA